MHQIKSAILLSSFGLLLVFAACKKEEVPVDDIDVGEVSYDGDVKSILSSNCSPCHFSSSPSAGLDLSTKASAESAIETRNLIGRINSESNPMPQAGLMSAEKRAKIQAWKDQGYN